MSKFSVFMKANKKVKENEKYAPTESMTDAAGKPLEWEFKHITSKENDNLRDTNTKDIPVTGKPNIYRQKLDASKYLAQMITASTVYPDLYDSELQDSYGVKTPEDLLYAMVDDPGEYQELCNWMQKFQGFTKIRWKRQKTNRLWRCRSKLCVLCTPQTSYTSISLSGNGRAGKGFCHCSYQDTCGIRKDRTKKVGN